MELRIELRSLRTSLRISRCAKSKNNGGPILEELSVVRAGGVGGGLESAQLRSPVKNELHRREEQHGEYESWDPGHRDLNPHPEKCVASARSSRRPGRLFRGVDRYASMAKMWGSLFTSNTNSNTITLSHTVKSFKINSIIH